MTWAEGVAPGRLDVLGGVADYAGSLVLEVPTHLRTTVIAEPAHALVVGDAVLSPAELTALSGLTYPAIRAALESLPRWTLYPIGIAIVLVRHGLIDPPQVHLQVSSDIPQSVGVSSSAALEVATARALLRGPLDPLRLAALCQEAENHVVGAPCGIMDQVTVALGTPGVVLPILCRPASVLPTLDLPATVEVVGCPTGVARSVGGAPYVRARVAAFMGKRMIEEALGRPWAWGSDLPRQAVDALPDELDGAAFLDRWGPIADGATTVDAVASYPVRAATGFGGDEHARALRAMAQLACGRFDGLGPIMAASHAAYAAMGLGHPAADAVVDEVVARHGVYGARSSGGGCGGTVVVVGERGSLEDVGELIR